MHDGLNIGEVMAYEAISRRFQLWEEAYSASLRESETGAAGAGDWLDERHLFLGGGRSRGHALVSPELEEWVADRLQKESAVLKERSKAREERVLARSGGGEPRTGRGANGKGRGRTGAAPRQG